MANFTTHISVAAGASAMAATTLLGAHVISAENTLWLTLAGTLGGILPDVDSDHSHPLQIIFISLYGIAVFALLQQLQSLSIIECWGVLVLTYVGFRYAFLPVFKSWTVHRGIFHSVLAAVFFWFLTTCLLFWVYHAEPTFCWMMGLFVALGYLVHLSLDELYSVDFNNKRLKRSSGTAFKLINKNNLFNSGLFFIATVGAYYFTPPSEGFVNILFNTQTYQAINNGFLP
jgi:hypothetical protein